MGLYDTVKVCDPRFVCSEGHDLSDEGFQTKDLGCTMGTASIDIIGDGDLSMTGCSLIDERSEVTTRSRLTIHSGGWGDPPQLPYLGRMYIYCSCSRCPAFVQAGTGNFCPTGVEFEVEVVDDIVRAIKRVSESTADYIENEPRKPYMVECEGPMSYEAAYTRHIEYPRDRLAKDLLP